MQSQSEQSKSDALFSIFRHSTENRFLKILEPVGRLQDSTEKADQERLRENCEGAPPFPPFSACSLFHCPLVYIVSLCSVLTESLAQAILELNLGYI